MEYILGNNEHFTVTKNDSSINVDELSGEISTLEDFVDSEFESTAAILNVLNEKCDNISTKNITYSALKTLRNRNQLVPGSWYRITDYVTTTASSDTQSAGHQFYVIVRADDVNVLNENAYAAKHAGDTYFANSKLEAWKLKYSLDNDISKFEWADSTNGKGVIYYMKDEFGNECPYDFKNIMFKRYKITQFDKVPSLVDTYSGINSSIPYGGSTLDLNNSIYRYTFDYLNGTTTGNDLTVYQYTQSSIVCYNNIIDEYYQSTILGLNNIVIGGASYGRCFNNTFGNSCYNNTFGDNCCSNVFGDESFNNTFGDECQCNVFGDDCCSNTFGDGCSSNTFGDSCSSNTFGGYCSSNTFGNNCHSNTFTWYCTISRFGDFCFNNTFGHTCKYNVFGNGCQSNTLGNHCDSNTFGNSCNNNNLESYSNFNIFQQKSNFGGQLSSNILFETDDIYQKKDNTYYPIAHPDLSTQPSILPQRFGNLPIKEVLIANGREDEIPNGAMVIEAWSFNETQCTPAFVEWSKGSKILHPNFNLPIISALIINYKIQYSSTTPIDLLLFSFVINGKLYKTIHSGDDYIVFKDYYNGDYSSFFGFYVTSDSGGKSIQFSDGSEPSTSKITDILYNGHSIFSSKWSIINSNDVTPDFTLVKYIEQEGGGYYYSGGNDPVIPVEGDVQIFDDSECTRYATGVKNPGDKVYARVNVPWSDAWSYGSQGGYFEARINPYIISVYQPQFWSQERETPYTQGEVVECVFNYYASVDITDFQKVFTKS